MIRTPASSTMRTGCAAGIAALVATFTLTAGLAHAQLRIVTYNTTTGQEVGVQTPRAGTDIVLKSIGEELRNGIARPIDVLLLQEQYTMAISTQAVVDLLNGIYGSGTYARGFINGSTSHPFAEGGRPGIVYNTNTVSLVQEVAFGSVSGSAQARSTMRYRLRPDGYDEGTADFYVYNSHYKAGTTATDQNRRNIEATSIRNNATYGSNALGEGAHAIFTGDHNFYTSTEAAFQTLTAAGAGQAVDPINRVGAWSNNGTFDDVHTQSTCSSSCGDFASSGVDDRFDFQLVTGEFLDGEGLSIIDGSYRAFGNNGVSFNQAINNAANLNVATGYPFSGVTSYTRTQVLNALRNVTDHLPVVADYQLPAVLSAIASAVPETFNVGDDFSLELTVSNAANVLVAGGADELDFSITTMLGGAALNFSSFEQVDAALGGGNVYQIALDTSSAGMKSDLLSIASSSQGVPNPLIEIPISYLVLADSLTGDYNNDGLVDAADYTHWRNNLGGPEDALFNRDPQNMGDVSLADYDSWKTNYGQSLLGSGGLADSSDQAVPEPAAWLLLALGGCLCCTRVDTLKAWNRAT